MEEPPSYHSVQVIDHSELNPDSSLIVTAVRACLDYIEAPPSDVRILVTDDAEVAAMNQKFRGIASPTDVLTFPDEDQCSGDIAIAAPYALRQSQVRGIPFDHEMILLAIHGALHLAGMEDETEEGRREMISQMYTVASRVGLPKGEDWGSLLHQEEA